MQPSLRLALVITALFSSCGGFAPVSRGEGDTCNSSTDCKGDLYCGQQKRCLSPRSSSGGGSGSSGGGSGSTSSCSPACSSSEICITNANGGPTCLDRCNYDDECNYCCATLQNGGGACAQTASQCGSTGGACPSGTYRETSGGPCVSRPSSCGNGWTVCTCPETHGAWCHPGCGQAGNPGLCNGSSC